ncbi:MAG: CaiB/BaiF CoA transferase family protein [Tepidiformaceae bacterium]
MSGPLTGTKVVELASEIGAWAGKLLADMGADVVLVEPLGGHYTRDFGPFADDIPGRERSLWFWHYNVGKKGVTLDLDEAEGRAWFERLIEGADIVIEAEPEGRLDALGIGFDAFRESDPRLITVSISAFGRGMPRADEQSTDLTILASGGPAWSCGYDDHTLPPVRGGGNQGYQTASHFAVMSALAALVHRDAGGPGQHIDVNAHAASNVTTEAGSYSWLVAKQTVQRQTGRHAAVNPTAPTQVRCADGKYANTGIVIRQPGQYRHLHEWLTSAGLVEQFEQAAVLEWAMEGDVLNIAATDDETRSKLQAGRDAVNFLAANLPAYEFFAGGQARDLQVSIIYSPEEVIQDPHMVARGFPTEVYHDEIGRSVVYPGAFSRFTKSPMVVGGAAPRVGEHNEELLSGTL